METRTFKLKRLSQSAFTILVIVLFTAITAGCSKQDKIDDIDDIASTPLISKISVNATSELFNYNAQGKLDRFTYENNKIWWKSNELDGSGQPKYSSDYYIDASHGKINMIIYRAAQTYQSAISYDERGRVKTVDVKISYDSNNYTPYYKAELQWDAQNRLILIKITYEAGVGYLYEFSDFKDFKNTIGYKNLNFKHFGEYGLGAGVIFQATPSRFFDLGLFPGTQVPGKQILTVYKIDGTIDSEQTYNFSYNLDSKNRIVSREFIGLNITFRYEYKD